ncbi:MAG TPA: N-acetylmuramoyl-L-alanine amidase [Actinomycetota bacterium]|nr:N-acetylmuramoyl-L-alanine amidase [Actinomycetota bacterium]
MRSRFPVVVALVLGIVLILPVTGLPGIGPRPVPTRMQTLDLAQIGMPAGRGMSGVEQPTASRSAVIETDPFGLVGLSWDQAPPPGSVVKVRVREQSGWTSWLQIPFAADHGPDPASAEAQGALAGTDPMLTGTSDAVQVWVQTPDGQAPPNTQVHLVDTDDVDIQQPALSQAAAAPGMPPIITRAQWGADESMRNRDPVYSSVVKVGFVHHTVSSSTYTKSQAAAQMRNLYAWYTKGLKYSDMAYNFLVDRFGRLYEGRAGGMDRPVVGGHTAGLNNDSFAVSAMGNFDEYNPTDAKMDAIKESIAQLMAWKLGLSKRDPGGRDNLISTGSLNSGFWEKGQVATLNRVSGHRDAGNTACPGKYLYAHVPDIRARAAQLFASGPDPVEIPDLLTPDPVTDEFNFRGSGSGDGVGLPRAGVLGQARDGKKATGILTHYLTGVTVAGADDQRVLKVALAKQKKVLLDSISLGKGGGRFKVGSGKNGFVGSATSRLRAVVSGDQVVVQQRVAKKWRQVSAGPKVLIRWAGTRSAGRLGQAATAMRVGGDQLRRGTVTISAVGGMLRVIGNLRVHDEYLPYLETVPRSWPGQAQRAMAITARTKALAAVWNPDCGCHVDDSGFTGQRATGGKGYAAWRNAVTSTATGDASGLTVLYDGAVIDIPVFESTGGATLNGADVWGKAVPWARSVEDPWSLQAKNTPYAAWSMQTRAQSQVAQLFGLPDVVQLDLRTRLTGGAVATATATSSTGQTASITGEQLRTGLDLPSAYIARSATQAPVAATSLSADLADGHKGAPVVVQATDTAVVALAAAYAGNTRRPLYVVGRQGPTTRVGKALRPAKSLTAVGSFSPAGLKSLGRLAKVRRVTASTAPALSLKLAAEIAGAQRRPAFVAAPGNLTALASAAMAAVRARGFVLAIDGAPSPATVKWVRKHAKRAVVVAGRKEISNTQAGQLRRPVRLATTNPVVRSARLAALGSRRGDAVLVDSRRPMAAAAAAASGQPVLMVTSGSGNGATLRFLQASPAIAGLRSVGAAAPVVDAARRA